MAGRLPGLCFGKRGEAGTRDRKGYTEQPSWDGVATHVINTSSFWCWVLISKQVGVEGSGDGDNVLEGLERDEFTRKSHHARPRPVSDLVINRGGPAERTSTFPQHEVDPQVGYCQGLPFLVAVLLLNVCGPMLAESLIYSPAIDAG